MRRVLILLAACGAITADAATVSDVLTSGGAGVRGAFITTATGARAVGMGEAFTAVADDASAGSWNPGGLGQIRSLAAEAMFDAVGEGIGVSYAAIAVPAGSVTLGGSVSVLSFGSYDVRDASGLKTGTGSVSDTAASVSAALANPGWLGGRGWTGATVDVVKETVGGTLLGIGLGSVVPINEHFTAGWAVQHLGPPVAGFSLPSTAKLGLAVSPLTAIRLAADGGYLLAAKQPFVAAGVEYTVARMLALRAGYRYRDPASSAGGLTGVMAGAGFRLGRLGLDYAYQPFGDLAVSHRVALIYGPPVREDVPSHEAASPASILQPAQNTKPQVKRGR